jgi:Amidohydrolase
MKYFDCHLHLPSPDVSGLDQLLRYLDGTDDLVGGNLILNTRAEIDLVYSQLRSLPSSLNIIPYYEATMDIPREFLRSGWYKVHSRIQRLELSAIQPICQSLSELEDKPKGIIVHCFPWGSDLQFNISLPLVIELARALPQTAVLAAHGGGYESWAFRAHAGMLKNVLYDFSVTMSYYRGSDVLRPFQRYLLHSPDRVLFGSDWPSAQSEEQLSESIRLAGEIGIAANKLESIFMENARRLWPGSFKPN